jgi:DNA-binding SARP family transcriptional activator
MAHQRRATRTGRSSDGVGAEVVRVWLLGGFRVSVEARSIRWRRRKAGSLIKLLALARGHRMHREQVMELLWPELDGKSQANNLHHTLYFARKALDPAPAGEASRQLTLGDGVLSLCPDGPLWVDVEVFEDAARTARLTREPAAYRAAIELYAGELLPEDRYEAWTEKRREELRQLYLELLVELAGLYEQREEYEPAIEALRRAVAEERANEEAHAGLIRLYALSGRRAESLGQYGRLRKVLSEEFGIEPGDSTRRLYEEIRAGRLPVAPALPEDKPSKKPLDSARHNLPAALSSFVGREREIPEVRRALSMTRLLTLTGTGGCGKTRLALEVARDLVGAYPGGVWLVELAPLSEDALVPQAVAGALGVREQPGRSPEDALADHLKSRDLLLILDNCEHFVDATARLTDALLRACPKLRVLATSREPLGVSGEMVWTVPPLSLPDADAQPTAERLMQTEAVRLFVERARSRLPRFELNEENAAAVAAVCRKLDGIPLAIELAAARIGALAVEQVVQRLENSLGLLTGGARMLDPRHRTMRATLGLRRRLLAGSGRRGLFWSRYRAG